MARWVSATTGPTPGDRRQTLAHIIVADDGQQAAVQYAELFAKYLPDNEQRLDQLGYIAVKFEARVRELVENLPKASAASDCAIATS